MVIIWRVGMLFGSMLFISFTVAPTVVRSLSKGNAGLFLRRLFPGYYLWDLVIVLLSASIAMGTNAAASVALLLVAVLFVFERQSLMPSINNARDEELQDTPGTGRRFKYLHFSSVFGNGL